MADEVGHTGPHRAGSPVAAQDWLRRHGAAASRAGSGRRADATQAATSAGLEGRGWRPAQAERGARRSAEVGREPAMDAHGGAADAGSDWI